MTITTNLSEFIAEATKAADKWFRINIRSHAALYAVLGRCYALYLEAQKQTDTFTRIADNAYVKVTGKTDHPLALLVIKFVFRDAHPEHDLRRLFSRWATVLAHLDEANVPVEHVARFIGDLGGVHGCVEAYKNAQKDDRTTQERRQEDHVRIQTYLANQPKIGNVTKVNDGEEVCVINTVEDQQTLRALAQQPGRVLLLGEIDEEFDLRVVCVVERDAGKIDKYLSNKAKTANIQPPANSNIKVQNEEKEVAYV